MFLKVLLGIYLASVLAGSLLFVTAMAECGHKWKEQHPEYVGRKGHWFDWVRNIVRFAFMFGCPLLNTVIAVYLLFDYNDYCDELMKRVEESYAQRHEENQEVL